MKVLLRNLCLPVICSAVILCGGLNVMAAKEFDGPIQIEDGPIQIEDGPIAIDLPEEGPVITVPPRIVGPIKPPRFTFEPIEEPEETPEPTPEPTPSPTPLPTLAPDEVLVSEAEEQVEGNMIEAASATFSGISDITQCKWFDLYGSTIGLGEGRTGNGLVMTAYDHRWSTPAIDLGQYITEPGTYTISYSVKARFEGDTFMIRNLIRSSSPLSFAEAHNDLSFSQIGENTPVKNDEWTTLTMKLRVIKADIKTGGEWNFCFDGMENLIDLSIDDFTVIKEDPNAARATAAMLYNPGLKGVALVATCATAAIVSVTVSFKIVKDIIKKRREQA